MYCYNGNVNYTCGLALLGDFRRYNDYSWHIKVKEVELKGTGFGIAGFINNSVCKSIYNDIIDKFEIVYQSPVRKNKNTGRDFFFIVFKEKES